MIRAAEPQILDLLDAAFNAVGFPKADGKWNSMLCLSLEEVRLQVVQASQPKQEHALAEA